METHFRALFPTNRPVIKTHLLILMGIKAANSMEFLESQSLVKAGNATEYQAQVNSSTLKCVWVCECMYGWLHWASHTFLIRLSWMSSYWSAALWAVGCLAGIREVSAEAWRWLGVKVYLKRCEGGFCHQQKSWRHYNLSFGGILLCLMMQSTCTFFPSHIMSLNVTV